MQKRLISEPRYNDTTQKLAMARDRGVKQGVLVNQFIRSWVHYRDVAVFGNVTQADKGDIFKFLLSPCSQSITSDSHWMKPGRRKLIW